MQTFFFMILMKPCAVEQVFCQTIVGVCRRSVSSLSVSVIFVLIKLLVFGAVVVLWTVWFCASAGYERNSSIFLFPWKQWGYHSDHAAICPSTYFPFLKIWNEFVTCDWHFPSVKVFSDVQLLYLNLVHICLLIIHGNCFCAPLKWTFRTYNSQWWKHLQTHVAAVTVSPRWFAVVLRLFP